jgi:hypothetical protein
VSAPRIFTLLTKKIKAKSRDKINLLPRRHSGPGVFLQQLYGQPDEGLLAADRGGVHRELGEVLGMIWVSVKGTLSLPQDKLERLRGQASLVLSCPFPSCRQVMVLTGLFAAFHKAVPLLRLKGRFIQLSLNSVYSSEKDLQKKVTLLPEARRDLLWMTQFQLFHCHGHLWPLSAEDCTIEVQMDASDQGFGIWFGGHLHSGRWDSINIWRHINARYGVF